MNLIDWINQNCPGRIERFSDRIEVAHETGEFSTLWFATDPEAPNELRLAGDPLSGFDGIDLFSSTFKIASSRTPRSKGGVEIVFNLEQMAKEFSQLPISIDEEVTPFMYQQGIGIYAVSEDGKRIYEWDTELGELSDEYEDFYSILEEWLEAVS